MQVRAKVHGGAVTKSEELYAVDPTVWAARETSLKDTRDVKELMLLTHLLLLCNQRKVERLVDVVAMRIRELKFAKSQGQSWEKAEVVALTPNSLPGTAPVPDLAMAL